MVGVDRKAQLCLGRSGEFSEEIVGRLDHRPACLANEVSVGVGSQRECRRSVAQVGMDDHAKVLQLIKGPIDRREMDVGRFGLYGFSQLLCAEVAIVGEEHLEQDSARRRDAAASRAQERQDLVDRREVEIAEVLGRHDLFHQSTS